MQIAAQFSTSDITSLALTQLRVITESVIEQGQGAGQGMLEPHQTLTRGRGHAVALPAEPADAGLAVGRGVEELEVEGLHGLLLGLAVLARGG